MHLVRHLQRHQMGDELARIPDIYKAVLERPVVGAGLHGDREDWRLAADDSEKRERRDVRDAIRRQGTQPADRPGQHGRYEQLIGMMGVEFVSINDHGTSPAQKDSRDSRKCAASISPRKPSASAREKCMAAPSGRWWIAI